MKTPQLQPCLTADQLQRFLAERLDEGDEARAQAHVDACSSCRRALEEAAADEALWQDVATHLRPSSLGAEESDSEPDPLADVLGVRLFGAEESDSEPDPLADVLGLLAPTDDPASLGRLGAYEIRGVIGRGSTGIVMKAFEPSLNRFVAIKLLSPVYRPSGPARRRFEREGRAIASVVHEHVVPIFAVDEHDGLPYLVMQYVPGQSLEERLASDGPLDPLEVTRIALQVSKALAAAHAQGIVHRDVKPANVLLESGVERALVTDFGLARVADDASMTRSGTLTGTPQYMSPEQARGDVVDARSDLFSLGSLMYSACTARPPFRAETVFGVLHRVTESEPRPIREIQPRVPAWLGSFVERLMKKRPEQRFASADVVTRDQVLAVNDVVVADGVAGAEPAAAVA